MTFSETEKKNIQERLLINCEESWARLGYKKTSVDDLCRKAGISKGSFYLFYESKEELFCAVMIEVQKRLITITRNTLGLSPRKKDLAKALQVVYREYVKIPFIRETKSADFIAFINRLSPKNLQELENHGRYDLKEIIKSTGLTYKIEEEKALSALSFVSNSLQDDEQLSWDALETFDFIIDTLVEKIFD